jgi:hypothetical protein
VKKSQEYELRKYVGDIETLCGITPFVYDGGPGHGVRAFRAKNGQGLSLTIAADRGLDIPHASFKGVCIGFSSATGVRAPAFYDEDGARGFLKQFYAGLLTTCGITYAGAACEDEGRKLGLHGPYSNTPAQAVCADAFYDGDEKKLRFSGSVREACVFGENMLLKREIIIETERSILHVRDTVENQGFSDQPLMLVYHVNFGYPLLDDGARVYANSTSVAPRDEIAAAGFDKYRLMEAPGIGRPEECFFHTPPEDGAFAALHNPKLGMAAILRYDAKALPLLCQWKCMQAGNYALGLEPTTAGVMGRSAARAAGALPMLAPGDVKTFTFSIELTDDDALIDSFKARAR